MSCCINVDQFSSTKPVAYKNKFLALSDFNPVHFLKHNFLVYLILLYMLCFLFEGGNLSVG